MGCTLELLKIIANGITKEFGTDCEVVIYDLKTRSKRHSAIYVLNGQVTGCRFGDNPTKAVMDTISKSKNKIGEPIESLTYTSDGRSLKQTVIAIPSETEEEYKYLLAINYDITHLMAIDKAVRALVNTTSFMSSGVINCDKEEGVRETLITDNVNDMLEKLISQSIGLIGKPVSLMSKSEKITAIKYLNDAGAFLIMKAGDRISKEFGISKFTLYSYIDVNNHKQAG